MSLTDKESILADLNFEYLKIYFDGGSRGNPGPSAVGAVVYDKNDNIVEEIAEYIGQCTNNVAEYRALEKVLDVIKKYKNNYNVRRIIINTDSKLVHNQLKKIWKIKDENLFEIYKRILKRLKDYELVDLRLVPREQNIAADRLVNVALDREIYGSGGSKTLLNGNNVKFGAIDDK